MIFTIPDETLTHMQTQSSLRITFISTLSAPFIQDDLETLKRYYRTEVQIGSGIFHIFKIALSCFRSDIAFCWFASTYTSVAVALMRLLGRRSVLVIGGVDVAKDENLKYGIWLVPWKALLVRYAIRHANKIMAVDKSLAEKACHLVRYDGKNIEIVPTGYDVDFWKLSEANKAISVLTVAIVNDELRFRVKGIDMLFEVARSLPHISFTMIGLTKEIIKLFNPPSNVELFPSMDRKLLLPYYQRAKVYCQPSRHEGMSNVLCEAMLCGCIPVATDVGATKSVLGEIGMCVPPDVDALTLALIQALQLPEKICIAARERIISRFDKGTREKKLTQIVELLLR
jgi:glycosyltransferase involved in cell wall biosynthesis